MIRAPSARQLRMKQTFAAFTSGKHGSGICFETSRCLEHIKVQELKYANPGAPALSAIFLFKHLNLATDISRNISEAGAGIRNPAVRRLVAPGFIRI